MLDKNLFNQAEGVVRPIQNLVTVSITVPDPNVHQKIDQKLQKCEPKMEGTVKKLIAHFLDSK